MSGRFNQASYCVLAANASNPITPAANSPQLDGTQSQNAAFGTVPIWVKDLDAWGLQLATPAGSTYVGTLTVQASCERSNTEQTGAPDVTLADWTTIAFRDASVTTGLVVSKAIASGAQSILIADDQCRWRWVRFLVAFTSGAGSPRMTFQQKGYS